jgi:hypothetical protein
MIKLAGALDALPGRCGIASRLSRAARERCGDQALRPLRAA